MQLLTAPTACKSKKERNRSWRNINQPFRSIPNYLANPGAFPILYPPLGTINYWDFGSNSIYNAGQVTLRRRGSGGFFYRFSYTL